MRMNGSPSAMLSQWSTTLSVPGAQALSRYMCSLGLVVALVSKFLLECLRHSAPPVILPTAYHADSVSINDKSGHTIMVCNRVQRQGKLEGNDVSSPQSAALEVVICSRGGIQKIGDPAQQGSASTRNVSPAALVCAVYWAYGQG